MDNFINLIIIAIGLIIGSFINVLSYRIPKKLPIMFSRSICPKCESLIPLYRNIPIITYILQKRRCHHCNASISIQYPLIELTTSVIFFLGMTNIPQVIGEQILFLWISTLLITISIIDLRTFTIPLSLLFYILIGEIVFLLLNLYKTEYMLSGLMFGLGYLGMTFLITSIIYKKETLGYGDLLLISLIGLWIGPINILICIFLSSLTGIIIWGIKRLNKVEVTKLPFGTYLSVNAILLKIIHLDSYVLSYLNL